MSNRQDIPNEVVNAKILELLDKRDNGEAMAKLAETATSYTRTQIREDSFAMKIIPSEKATNDQLDRDLDERLRIIEELEPDSPGALWVPFQTVSDGEYMFGSRYEIRMARIRTPKFVKDIDELRTYRQDLRKILTDNAIKDGLAAYDGKFIETCNRIVYDTTEGQDIPGPQSFTGKVQYRGFSGGLTKENFVQAKKMLMRGSVTMPGKFRLRNHIALMNDVTAQDWQLPTTLELGDAPVTEMYRNGITDDSPFGIKTIFTLKDDLIPDNHVYFFAAPEYLGKAYYMTDWTVETKKEDVFIEQQAFWMGGMGIGNVAGVCLANFDYNG